MFKYVNVYRQLVFDKTFSQRTLTNSRTPNAAKELAICPSVVIMMVYVSMMFVDYTTEGQHQHNSYLTFPGGSDVSLLIQ